MLDGLGKYAPDIAVNVETNDAQDLPDPTSTRGDVGTLHQKIHAIMRAEGKRIWLTRLGGDPAVAESRVCSSLC